MERPDLSRDAGDRHSHPGRRERWERRDWLAVALIVLATGSIGLPGIGGATLGWSDAPLHLFDGVFVLEFVKAWPIADARAWAEQFYLRHPAIGIGVYYPPGFAAIEAIVFSIFGVSIIAARALVVVFAAGACILLYEIGRNWFDRTTGLFAAAFLLTMPHAAFWMRDVMLEWPATFWILAAVAAYQRDLDRPRALWALATWAAVLAAFLTKQTAAFIGPVIALHTLLMPTRRAYWSRIAPWTGFTIATLCIATYAWITRDMTSLASRLTAWSPDFLFYPRRLPEICGWAFVGLAIASFMWMLVRSCGNGIYASLVVHADSPARRANDRCQGRGERSEPAPGCRLSVDSGPVGPTRRSFALSGEIENRTRLPGACCAPPLATIVRPDGRNLALPGMAIAAWFLLSSIIEAKESRYLFFALPILAMFAAAIGRSIQRVAWRRIRIAAFLCLVILQAWLSHSVWPAELPRYAIAADLLAGRPDADLVLVDAVRDGQFVFDVFDNPATRDRIIPLRASKLLYARAAREKYNYQQFVESPADIVALLDRHGVRFIVMESQLPDTPYRDADPPPRRMLRELVENDPRFVRCLDQSLACGDPSWKNVRLRVYEYTTCPPRRSDSITLSMPGMGGSVTLKLPPTHAAK